MAALKQYGNDAVRIVYDIANAHFIGEDFAAGLQQCRERLALVHLSDTGRRSIATIRSASAPFRSPTCRARWLRSATPRGRCWRSSRAIPTATSLPAPSKLAVLGFDICHQVQSLEVQETVMSTALPHSADVIVVGGGNAAFCAALAAAEQGVSVLVLERAPEDEAGGNSRFTAGAFRCVYDGVEDLRALMPDLTDEEIANIRLRHLHRGAVLRRHGPRHRVPHRSRPVRALVTRSKATMLWMRDKGVRFMPIYGRQAFKIDGMFKFWGGLTVEAVGGGPGLVEAPDQDRAARTASPSPTSARALSLIADDDGVKGVRVKHQGKTVEVQGQVRGARRRRLRGQCRNAHALSRARLGSRQGARHALQHRRRHPHGARHRRACRPATGRAATRSAGTATRRSSAISTVGDNFQKHSYPLGIMINANGERFVDEGADFRNYTYAKYGRVILSQPGQFAWQVFDNKVMHLLRDEYRIKRVTKVTRQHARRAGAEARRRERRKALETIKAYNAAVMTDVPFDPNVKDGRGTEGSGRSRNRTGPTPSISRRSRPMRSPAASPSPSAASRSTPARASSTPTAQAIPGLFAAGELVGGIVLLQLSRRHRPDERRGVRQDRRHHRRPARQADRRDTPWTPPTTSSSSAAAAAGSPPRSRRARRPRVVLLEKNAQLGGSTAWSIGSVTASGTPHQARKGIVRTARRITGATWPASTAISMRATIRRCAACWPTPCRIRSAGCSSTASASTARCRSRRTASRACTMCCRTRSRSSRISAKAARRAGVDDRLRRARDCAGRASRAAWWRSTARRRTAARRFRARGGVVLATGDFTSDPELKAQFMGPQEAKIDGVNVTATGDGQKLALPLGARIVNGDLALGPELRFVPPQRRNILLSLPPWRAAGESDGVVARTYAERAAAPVRDELRDHGAGAVARSVRRGRDPDQQARRALHRRARQTGLRAAGSARQGRLHPARPAHGGNCFPAGRISSRPRPASPMPMSTTTGATARDIFTRGATLDALASKLAMPAAALAETLRAHNASAGNRPQARRRALCGARAACARCSCMRKAGSPSITSIACWAQTTSRSPGFTRPVRPGRAACCSRATAIILAGPSRPDGARGAMRRRNVRGEIRSSPRKRGPRAAIYRLKRSWIPACAGMSGVI